MKKKKTRHCKNNKYLQEKINSKYMNEYKKSNDSFSVL